MYKVLGITTMTESAAVYMVNGEIKHAVEEERFSRIKHSGGIPYSSIDYILNKENINISDIDCLAVYWNPYLLPERVIILFKNMISNIRSCKTKLMRAIKIFKGSENSDSGWGVLMLNENNS